MEQEYFLVKTFELAPNVILGVLFHKKTPVEEMVDCKFKISTQIADGQTYEKEFDCRYVIEDNLVSIEVIGDLIYDQIQDIIKTVESIDSGSSLLPFFTIDQESLSSTSIEVRKETKKALRNITKYKLQPYIIDLYHSVLILYKGTDTLQKRKFQKMIEAQEDAIQYYRSGGRF